jgi:glycosyltransferase involved in cell wall biosynthesis
MKVLHVVPSFAFGGMEKVVSSIINLTSKYYEHEILVLYDNTEAKKWIKDQRILIHCLKRPKSQLKYLKILYKSLKEIMPQILMSYNWGATDAIWLGRISGIRNIIHSEHGFNIDEAKSTSWKRNIIRLLVYRMTSRIVVVSHELEKMMKDVYALREDRIQFIANGIDTEVYSPDILGRIHMRKLLGFTEENFVIGFSGRLDPVKNFDLMLEILGECVKRDKNIKLLVIGDGPERQNFEKKCQDKNLEKSVLLVGQKENVVPYLRSLDVFLLTSLREQMPMTILEAMAVALPVVSTDVGEVARLVQHGKNGMVWDVHAGPETFATSLLALRDKKTLQDMGEVSRRKIVTEFREESMVQHYQNVIDSLCRPIGSSH